MGIGEKIYLMVLRLAPLFFYSVTGVPLPMACWLTTALSASYSSSCSWFCLLELDIIDARFWTVGLSLFLGGDKLERKSSSVDNTELRRGAFYSS